MNTTMTASALTPLSPFEGQPVMAVLRNRSVEDTVALTRTAFDAGIALVEVPIQSPDAIPALEAAAAAAREVGRTVGAGTIIAPEQVAVCARLGVAFTVAPGFDPDVADASRNAGIPHLPGVATPSEVQRALRAGFSWLKVFPATVLTPEWISAARAPFPDARFLASGGISVHNAASFFKAGASGVAIGSALESPSELRQLMAIAPTGR